MSKQVKPKKKRAGRPRGKDSDSSLGHMGLTKEEDATVQKLLDDKDRSLGQVQRYLFREWIKQQSNPESGLLKLNKY